MKVRFQADADLNEKIVAAVTRREPAIDFRTATEANLARVSDPEVLAIAAEEGCVLVSHDASSMPRHFGEFIMRQRSSGLIVVLQDLPVFEAAEDLVLIWSAEQAEEWVNRIAFLPV